MFISVLVKKCVQCFRIDLKHDKYWTKVVQTIKLNFALLCILALLVFVPGPLVAHSLR